MAAETASAVFSLNGCARWAGLRAAARGNTARLLLAGFFDVIE